ncbi:hypothetical protein [Flavobacterium aquiphilum]|uniref:hypothetical protein n=1 Tax=Flavobacterium aquiphilum TaxID=3003261 RepID=UPI00248058FB|nr:hypothetical protein [Flavobacterium aquiphilum]
MIFIPSILDFKDEDTFLTLQNRFLTFDDRTPGLTSELLLLSNIKQTDFEIIYKRMTSYENQTYNTIYFYKDFLPKKIPLIADQEIRNINAEIEKSFKYKSSECKLYLDEKLQVFKDLNLILSNTALVKEHLKFLLLNENEKIIEFIYNHEIWHNAINHSNKIKLKLSRSEIICLFFLLKQKGLTESKYDSELGKLIENSFEYYSGVDDSYKEITLANKLLASFKNGDKSITTAAESLKNLLSDEDFYILK